MARARHDHIVDVLDFGCSEQYSWLVMELVEGETLDQRRRRLGRLSLPAVHHILRELGAAVAHAHSCGIIHNDIKPQNCMWTTGPDGQGHVKLLDFGIATAANGLTGTAGQLGITGTPAYMAPERSSEPGTVASDIYALGAVMYELITGTMPFEADSPVSMMMAHCTSPLEPASLRTLGCCPTEFDAIIERAMAKHPENRFSSVHAMLAALDGVALAFERAARHSAKQSDERANSGPSRSWEDPAGRESRPETAETPICGVDLPTVPIPRNELREALGKLPGEAAGRQPWGDDSLRSQPSEFVPIRPARKFPGRFAATAAAVGLTGLVFASDSNAHVGQLTDIPPPSVEHCCQSSERAPSTDELRAFLQELTPYMAARLSRAP